jgi:ADP-heptose:LPS heptosyltransferase
MGDSVYLLEIIRRLLENYTSLKIDVLTTGGNPIFPLFKDSFNKSYKSRYGVKVLKPLSPASYYKTVKDINKENYDIILDFTGMPVNIPLMLLFVQSYKAGFDMLDLRKKSYDYVTGIDNNIHIFDNYLNLVKPFFYVSEEKKFTINFNTGMTEITPLADAKTDNGNFINLVLSSSGGGNMSRRLPFENSAVLINLLIKNFPEYKINLLGGPTDYPYLESLCGGLDDKIVSVKKTKNISEAAELLKNSYFNICIDSGLMHISSLVNPNTYCLFGYSSPVNSLPFNNIGYYSSNMDCAPCSFYRISECKTLECMGKIDITKIIEVINRNVAQTTAANK